MTRRLLLAAVLASTGACTLAPKYVRPDLPVPPSWPTGDAYLRQAEAALPSIGYRDVFRDARLQALIDRALANNRDLRVSVANIGAARALYRIQRAELLPTVAATAGGSYGYRGGGVVSTTGTGTGTGGTVTSGGGGVGSVNVGVGVTDFEIDLFGRVRSLSSAALNRYFGTEAAARATRLTLVGDLASAWLTYAADRSLLLIAEDTARSARASVRLTNLRLQGGIAPRTDLRQAEQILSIAEADLASLRTSLAQDVNALQLLVGAPVDAALLPASIEEAGATIAQVPAGLDTGVLLRRPDVVEAEYELRARGAEIGAARAELFPRITLSALVGLASGGLSSLFSGDAFSATGSGGIGYPIFRAGAGRNNVRFTAAQQQASLATYERTVQSAFREVADALARRGTIADELAANRRGVAAALDTFRLTEARYRGGIEPFLATLDAQRSLYSARQILVQTQLTGAANLVTLYRTLGGDATLAVPPTEQNPAPAEPGRPR